MGIHPQWTCGEEPCWLFLLRTMKPLRGGSLFSSTLGGLATWAARARLLDIVSFNRCYGGMSCWAQGVGSWEPLWASVSRCGRAKMKTSPGLWTFQRMREEKGLDFLGRKPCVGVLGVLNNDQCRFLMEDSFIWVPVVSLVSWAWKCRFIVCQKLNWTLFNRCIHHESEGGK